MDSSKPPPPPPTPPVSFPPENISCCPGLFENFSLKALASSETGPQWNSSSGKHHPRNCSSSNDSLVEIRHPNIGNPFLSDPVPGIDFSYFSWLASSPQPEPSQKNFDDHGEDHIVGSRNGWHGLSSNLEPGTDDPCEPFSKAHFDSLISTQPNDPISGGSCFGIPGGCLASNLPGSRDINSSGNYFNGIECRFSDDLVSDLSGGQSNSFLSQSEVEGNTNVDPDLCINTLTASQFNHASFASGVPHFQVNNLQYSADPDYGHSNNSSISTILNRRQSVANPNFTHVHSVYSTDQFNQYSTPISISDHYLNNQSLERQSTREKDQYQAMVQYPYKPVTQDNYAQYTRPVHNQNDSAIVGESFVQFNNSLNLPDSTSNLSQYPINSTSFNGDKSSVSGAIDNSYKSPNNLSAPYFSPMLPPCNFQRVPASDSLDASFGSSQSSSNNIVNPVSHIPDFGSNVDATDPIGDQFMVPVAGSSDPIGRIRIELADSSCSSPMTSELGGVADSNSSNSYLLGGADDSPQIDDGCSSDDAGGDDNQSNSDEISETPQSRNRSRRHRPNGPSKNRFGNDASSAKQRHKANMRERSRMNKINKGFETLRIKLNDQTYPYEKKLSKVDTLRMAIRYIQDLTDMLKEHPPGSDDVTGEDGQPTADAIKRKMALQKVFINYRGSDLEKSLLGMANVHRLALSWGRTGSGTEGGQQRSPTATRTAKIWTPKKETDEGDSKPKSMK